MYVAVRQPGYGTYERAHGLFPPREVSDSSILASFRAMDVVLVEDSENEPPDFVVLDDDLGF